MKQILTFSIMLLLLFGQETWGQSIIMGSSALVNDIDEQPRYFYDPGGGGVPVEMGGNHDPNGYYAQDLRDTMMLQTNVAGAQLYVLFEEFAIGPGDTLWVFDGVVNASYQIGCYGLGNFPKEVYASGSSLIFVFHSDDVDVPGLMAGWTARVFAIPQQEINNGDITYVSTCHAMFYDSGGPDGNISSNNENPSGTQFVNFSSPVGTHIKCEFSQFSVNGVLQIYDGYYFDENKRLIGQFCTSTLDSTTNNMPPVLFSCSCALCFVYLGADGDINKAGWQAEISCVPELVVSYEGYAYSINNLPVGYYADVPNPKVIEMDTIYPTVVLKAAVNVPGRYTNDYMVEQIPYDENNMLFSYYQGFNINAGNDDVWLSRLYFPFTFVFFGKPYTSISPGANSIISFNYQAPGSNCSYLVLTPPTTPPYNDTVPYNYANSVYLVYEDLDPNHCSYSYNINYGVFGVYPSRAFVLNYNHIGLYSCCTQGQNMYNTYQMVLYEGTNIIDIYVKHRARCTAWNEGRGVIGLQNTTSSQILTVPGRNFDTLWTADNEAWRFTPISPKDELGELTWYEGTVDETHVVSYHPYSRNRFVAVNPTETTMYISEYKCIDAAGDQLVLRDTTVVLWPLPDSTGLAERCKHFEVYPNPTHDVVYVKMLNSHNSPKRIEVLDLQGRPLFAVPTEEITKVDLSQLPVGVYLLSAEGKVADAVKIVKQ